MIQGALLSVLLMGIPQTGVFHNANAGNQNVNEDMVAIQGFDPVAYFEQDSPVKGSPEITAEFDGVHYWFQNENNRKSFLENPTIYVPAFGGWCALGLALNPNDFGGWNPGKYPINPKNYKIIEGKLHLFYNADGFNALDYWEQNEEDYKRKALENWEKMKKLSPPNPLK